MESFMASDSRRQSALNGQRGDGALHAVGQRVIVETQPLQQRINRLAASTGGIRRGRPRERHTPHARQNQNGR